MKKENKKLIKEGTFLYANQVSKKIEIFETDSKTIWRHKGENEFPERIYGNFFLLVFDNSSQEFFDTLDDAVKKAEETCKKFGLKWK